MNTHSTDSTPRSNRPLGYWLKVVDRMLAAEFAAAFEGQGATRRDWRILNIVDGSAASDRPLRGPRVRALAERGWITRTDDAWTLTDEGRVAKQRLGDAVTAIRARVTDAVPADDLATTLATLETLAREFGWDENAQLPRKRRGRFGGHRHQSHGHGHGHFDHHPHHQGEHHRAHREIHQSEQAFGRGFEAGFLRGRDA